MSSIIRFPRFFAAVAALFGAVFLFSSAPVHAQSACKGLSKSRCTSSNSCSYVNGFTRSDGAKVKSFCRAKPGQGAGKSAKKSTKKKSVAKKGSAKPTAKTSTKKRATTKKTAKKKTTKKKAVKKTVAVEPKPKKKKTTKKTASNKKTTAKKKPAKKKKAPKKKKAKAGTS